MLKREYGKRFSECTSLRIGGPVFCWLEAGDLDGVLEAISIAEESHKPLAIIGRGNNILAQGKGFDGVVVSLGKGFDGIEIEYGGMVKVGASVAISRLVRECVKSELTGCEFLAGIPGLLGGAVFMNAGVRDIEDSKKYNEVKDIIVDVDILDLKNRKRQQIKKSDIEFGYRSSGLDGKCILASRIKLEKDKGSAINKRINSYMEKRKWIRALGLATAGSIFKNPDSAPPAGRLIEECGLRGEVIGGARIFEGHGNFIVNTDNASSDDVLELIKLARENVKEKFGIDLELELRLI